MEATGSPPKRARAFAHDDIRLFAGNYIFAALDLLSVDDCSYLSRQVFDRDLRSGSEVVGMALFDFGERDCQVFARDGIVRYGELAGYVKAPLAISTCL